MIPVLHIISDTNIGGGGRSLLSYLQYYDRGRFRMEVAMPRGSALAERVRALDVPSTSWTLWRTAPWTWRRWPPCAV